MRKQILPFLLTGFLLLMSSYSFAQRGMSKTITTTRLTGVQETFEHTEAISLESAHEMLVAPLVASVKVLSKDNDGKTFEKATFTGSARHDLPAGLAGNEYLVKKLMDGKHVAAIDVDLLKAQAIYDFCRETGADLIVVPQLNIRHKTHTVQTTDAEGNPLQVEEPVERDGKYVMIVEMVGFPAVYTGFREGTRDDRWIKELFMNGGQLKSEEAVVVEEVINKGN